MSGLLCSSSFMRVMELFTTFMSAQAWAARIIDAIIKTSVVLFIFVSFSVLVVRNVSPLMRRT